MSWGTEEDVDRIVRAKLKELRAKHKKQVDRLKAKIAKLEAKLWENRIGDEFQ